MNIEEIKLRGQRSAIELEIKTRSRQIVNAMTEALSGTLYSIMQANVLVRGWCNEITELHDAIVSMEAAEKANKAHYDS